MSINSYTVPINDNDDDDVGKWIIVPRLNFSEYTEVPTNTFLKTMVKCKLLQMNIKDILSLCILGEKSFND